MRVVPLRGEGGGGGTWEQKARRKIYTDSETIARLGGAR